MPAPTALRQQPEDLAAALNTPLPTESMCISNFLFKTALILLAQDEEFLLDTAMELSDAQPVIGENDTEMVVDEEGKPKFAAQKNIDGPTKIENRKVPIPPHRMSPLKASWAKVCRYQMMVYTNTWLTPGVLDIPTTCMHHSLLRKRDYTPRGRAAGLGDVHEVLYHHI